MRSLRSRLIVGISLVAVVPSKDLVVVRLGMSKTRGSWSRPRFLEQVLAAFE